MKMRTLVGQTVFLSASHFVVRVIGFTLRIWLSRELGAQAIGLVELAQSAQMLLITPVVSGLPAAMSRMCAKSEPGRQIRILRCGVALSLLFSIPAALLAFLLKTPLALWLGDLRTLPALLVYLPCMPVLGVSCALNGYFYGTGQPVFPALSEILEQIVRFLLTVRLVYGLRRWPLTLRAAIPAAATLAGETIALVFMLLVALRVLFGAGACGRRRSVLREMLSLALPLTGMRIVSSLMRTVQSVLIPSRLQVSGLSAQAALSQFGMLSGMMMPVLSLPSFVTCSLCMVAAPELARRQAQGSPQRAMVRRLLRGTLALGVACAAAVWMLSPVIARVLYRKPELLTLLRQGCMLVPLMALTHVLSGLMNGLGLQGASLRISLLSGLASLTVMYLTAAHSAIRLGGVIAAMAVSQLLTLVFSLRALLRAIL